MENEDETLRAGDFHQNSVVQPLLTGIPLFITITQVNDNLRANVIVNRARTSSLHSANNTFSVYTFTLLAGRRESSAVIGRGC